MRLSREQVKVGKTHASMSVGAQCVAPAPFNFEMASSPLPVHTPPPPPPPQSSQVVLSAALFAGMNLRIPVAFCCLLCITFYDHIFFRISLFVMLYCLCMCFNGRKFEIKFLPLVLFYNFVSTNNELSFVDKHIIHNH